MIRARAAITMIAHSVTQIANGTRRFVACSVRSNAGRFSLPHRKPQEGARMSIGSGMSIAVVWGWSGMGAS